MSNKISLHVKLDQRLHADAQRLIGGQFDNMDELIAEAVRALVRDYEMITDRSSAQPRVELLAVRQFKALLADLDTEERAKFNNFVESFTVVAGQPSSDEDMVHLLAVFKNYPHKNILAALHDAQTSSVPLTPTYLETLLDKVKRDGRPASVVRSVSDKPMHGHSDFDNPIAGTIAQLYSSEIGDVTAKVKEQITMYADEYPDLTQWHEAFEAAATMNKRNWRYVIAVVRGAGKKPALKGKDKRGLTKSERVRVEKRTRNTEYDQYWDAKLKAKQGARKDD